MRRSGRCLALLLLIGLQQLAMCQEEGAGATEEPPAASTEETPSSANPEADAAAAAEERERRKKKGEGLSFCGFDNCFELLGVTRSSGPIPIKRAYRRLANKYHPDKCESGDIAMCKELFPKYANAYEIVSNKDMRTTYEFVLDNPYDFPGFYMKFHSFKYAPKSDLRSVLFLVILALSGMQYLFMKSQYEQQHAALKKHPNTRYNERINDKLSSKLSSPKKGGSAKIKPEVKVKGEEREKQRKEAEAELDKELEAELGLTMPQWSDTFAVFLFKLPLTTVKTAQWYMSGGAREPEYMTRKALGVSAAEWATYTEEEIADLVKEELWVSENLAAYNDQLGAPSKVPLKQRSSKEKRAVRQRKHNPTNAATMLQD